MARSRLKVPVGKLANILKRPTARKITSATRAKGENDLSITKGVFMSDIHMPDNIKLAPLFNYMSDLGPDVVILGGDIVDASGMHGVDHMKASDVDMNNYDRDVCLARGLLKDIFRINKRAEVVYLEGNHEERYERLRRKYPKAFGKAIDFRRDVLADSSALWVPYGTYDSLVQYGDCVFIHGNIWPDNHAKAYALRHTPSKVVYGHLHHYQAYTTHRPGPHQSPRYAVTAGCLASMNPEWKKGAAHQWVNGFVDFFSDHGITVPTAHLIENNQFNIGAKVYK